MPKIVILGSCKNVPYELFAPRSKSIPDTNQLRAYLEWHAGNEEKSYEMAKKFFYPKIQEADIIIVISNNGKIGEHTQRDVDYAKTLGKQIEYVSLHSKRTEGKQ